MSHSPEEFFSVLKNQIDDSPYRDRYLQELRDHIDDAVYEQTVRGADAIEKEVMRRLGDPTQLSRHYNQLMNQSQRQLLLSYLLLVSIASIPLYLIASLWVAVTVVGIVMPEAGLVWFRLPLFLAAVAGLCAYYILMLRTSTKSLLDYGRRLTVYAVLIGIPLLCSSVVVLSLGVQKILFDTQTSTVRTLMVVVVTSLMLLIGGAASLRLAQLLNRWHYLRQVQRVIEQADSPSRKLIRRSWDSLRTVVAVAICLSLLGSVVLFWIEPTPAYWPAAGLFHWRVLFDFGLNLFGIITFGNSVFLPAIYWCLGCLLVTIIGLCVWQLWSYRQAGAYRIHQTLPWGIVICGIYACSLLAMPSLKPVIGWQMAVQPVSNQIEHRQLGPWYRLVSYLNHDEGRYATYQIDQVGEQIFINQYYSESIQPDHRWSLNVVGQPVALTATNITALERVFDRTPLPAELRCEHDQQRFTPKPWWGRDLGESIMITTIAGDQVCQRLWYKDQLIYSQPNQAVWPIVEQAIVTPDSTQLVLHLSHGAYNPESVFIVQL